MQSSTLSALLTMTLNHDEMLLQSVGNDPFTGTAIRFTEWADLVKNCKGINLAIVEQYIFRVLLCDYGIGRGLPIAEIRLLIH